LRLFNQIRFGRDNPLRYLHVPKSERLDNDDGDDSTALNFGSGDDTVVDREVVRKYGGIVSEGDLQ